MLGEVKVCYEAPAMDGGRASALANIFFIPTKFTIYIISMLYSLNSQSGGFIVL
jgi:hypothetical protein